MLFIYFYNKVRPTPNLMIYKVSLVEENLFAVCKNQELREIFSSHRPANFVVDKFFVCWSHSSNRRVSCQGQSRNKLLHHFIYFAKGYLSRRNFQRKLHQSNCSCISIGTNLLSLVISSITWALTSL